MSDDQEYQSRQLKRRIKQRQLHRLKHGSMETKKFLEQSIGPKSVSNELFRLNGSMFRKTLKKTIVTFLSGLILTNVSKVIISTLDQKK